MNRADFVKKTKEEIDHHLKELKTIQKMLNKENGN